MTGRRVLIGLVVVLVLAVLAGAGATWFFADELVTPNHSGGPYDVKVEGVEAHRVKGASIVFKKEEATARPGIFGFGWKGGHAVVGDVQSSTGDEVTRKLTDIQGRLESGETEGALEAGVWDTNPKQALGIPYRNVRYPDELGPMPAWKIPGRGTTWAIFTHGWNATPAAGLRDLRVLHKLKLPSLIIKYRNDEGAPKAPDGLIHLGYSEWEDLQSAVRYALKHGAKRVILIGESMGGAIVTRFMRESQLAAKVPGLVLDAPALDWGSIISGQAEDRGLGFLATPVEKTVELRTGANLDQLNEVKAAKDFQGLPILLFQGLQDQLVPPKDTTAFAKQLPGDLRYFQLPDAAHVESWNVNPPLYEKRLEAFLNTLQRRG